MRIRFLTLALCSSLLAVVAGLVLDGCSSVPDDAIFNCNPDATIPDPDCVPDAGPDGSADDGGGGSSIGPQACSGRCVPFPNDVGAGFWSREPLLVWSAPSAEVPDGGCPAGLAMQFDRYADLVAPPLVCDICGCEHAEGTCSGVPEHVEIRAGLCDDPSASTLPFGGPPAWGGACTDANALPAGAMCPPGSSTPCAQYVTASPLPAPTDETCKVTVTPVPTFGNAISWATRVLACRGAAVEDACGEGEAAVCVSDLPLPWRQCIWRVGLHDACPAPYTAEQFVTYSLTGYTDGRECTACECGAPEGGACVATLRLYDDAACGSQFNQQSLYSLDDQCIKILPPGKAIGAKAITDHTYMQGTCAPSGGEAIGEAQTKPEDALTFCCLPPFYDVQ